MAAPDQIKITHQDPMTTNYRTLCAEMLSGWQEGRDVAGPMNRARAALKAEPEGDEGDDAIDRWIESRPGWPNDWPAVTQCQLTALIGEALEHWGRPTIPPPLPPNFIDPEHAGQDRELLEVFYRAFLGEGGTADECILRGLKAVLAGCPAIPATPSAPEQGEVGELVAWMKVISEQFRLAKLNPEADQTDRAATLLQQQEAELAALRGVPVAVSERLPEPNIKVLAHYCNKLGKGRTICAIWVPAKTRASDSDIDEDLDLEYDDETDQFYWPEGWHEAIENWEEFGYLKVYEGEVAYWQPLPKWPANATPLPAPQAGEVQS